MARSSTRGCANFSDFPLRLSRPPRSRECGISAGSTAIALNYYQGAFTKEVILTTDLITSLYVFMLAAFIGFEVIRRVSPLLHTPLMSLTNALDAIAVVGAIILAGEYHAHGAMLAKVLGTKTFASIA